MCHSVEIYLPGLTRSAAEDRLRVAVPRASRRGAFAPASRGGGSPASAVAAALACRAAGWLRLPGTAMLLILAGCAAEPGPSSGGAGDPGAEGPADTQVIDRTGVGSGLESFTVRRHGRLVKVDFLNVSPGVYRVVATSRSGRGLDRGDARIAYDAAFAAAQSIDCGGQPLLVVADSAAYQEEDRRSVLTQGAPGWMFQGRCG